MTIGTPTYIAPEQAYAQPIDGRADLYSLSVMLYEMITGVPPFDADDVGTLLRMHVSTAVPRFSEVAPEVDVPEAVEALIRHGLEKNADNRIRSAKAYIDRIDAIVPPDTGSDSGLREIPSIVLDGFRGFLHNRLNCLRRLLNLLGGFLHYFIHGPLGCLRRLACGPL